MEQVIKTLMQYFLKAKKWFRDLINDTDEQFVVGTAIVIILTITLLIFLPNEIRHAKLIPLGFSEIEQIELDAERNHKSVDPITEYYAKMSDVTNKVFECWNTSLEFGLIGANEAFARELDARKNKIYKYEFDLLDTLPTTINKVLATLKKYIALTPTLRNVEIQFGEAWDEKHDDEYRTEIYFTTSTDSNGNTHTEMHTRQVYDHTDHSYWYHKPQGEKAYQSGIRMLKYFYRLDWPGNLMRPSRTNAEGEYAADKSRRVERHDRASLMEIATMWNTGSLYNNLRDDILAYNGMYGLMKVWEKDKDTAHDDSYSTGSSSDPGPKEYQSVENIRDLANRVIQAINQLVFSLQTTRGELPILKSKIEEYIAVVLNGKKGNANSLRREIISMSEKMYDRNFPHGINHNTFRVGLLILWVVIALILGFLIGCGLKAWSDTYDYTEHATAPY
jgi:hypothetical protein